MLKLLKMKYEGIYTDSIGYLVTMAPVSGWGLTASKHGWLGVLVCCGSKEVRVCVTCLGKRWQQVHYGNKTGKP